MGARVVMTRWKGVEANVLVAQTFLRHAQCMAQLLRPLAPWQRLAKLIQHRGPPETIAWSSSRSFLGEVEFSLPDAVLQHPPCTTPSPNPLPVCWTVVRCWAEGWELRSFSLWFTGRELRHRELKVKGFCAQCLGLGCTCTKQEVPQLTSLWKVLRARRCLAHPGFN